MRSPAAAFAWAFGRRHRWGLVGLVFYFAVLLTIRLLVAPRDGRVTFDDDLQFAMAVIVPLAATFMYFQAVFTFGLSGDLAARRSIYPYRMFTLPVTSAALALWPMLYGAMSMAALWLMTRLLALWPAGFEVPWIWPALFAAVILAWTQALTWMPYPWRGLRVFVTVFWLAPLGAVIMLALELEASEAFMVALLAPQLPLAYVVARYAVSLARRGKLPDWPRLSSSLGFVGRRERQKAPWSSPRRAQLWLEWRRLGRSLPAMLLMVLPFELSLLFAFRETPSLILVTLGAVLLTLPVLAAFAAATVSRSNPESRDGYELTLFIATRPLTSTALLGAKLQATILSTLAGWLVVAVTLPLALALSGTSEVVAEAMQRLAEAIGEPRAAVVAMLGLTALVVSTWRQLVQGLFLGMSGRAWIVKTYVFATLLLLSILVTQVPWVLQNMRQVIATVWNALPWVLPILAVLKIAMACWTAIHLYDQRLLSERALIFGALCWTVAVLALYAVLSWLVPTVLVRGELLVLVAILAVPLVRLAAAPLALSWNRHR